ncbi:MAG TPA: lysylphosphatidylglycerol synthase transmembrane domain-containing protein [Kofleriaceae bacterium]|nr:lysylphosphatidylglycerol synthase transmembrane domain-containing protein [Kofleriaceae bacterium]
MPRWLGTVLRLAGTAAGLAWIATQVDLAAAGRALGRVAPGTFVLAAALVAGNVVVAAGRWRALLVAYGAARIPPFARLTRLYFIAFFYNNYLPGAVAGDVGRGVVTRDAFPEEGAAGALSVVLVERALGLFGLFALLGLGLGTAGRALDTGALAAWTAAGCAGSCALVAAIPLLRRLAPHLPGPIGRIAGKLPALRDARAFVLALALSTATQALVVLAGWILLASLADLGILASLLIVPLAAATTFLPITVGGAGAREAVYVALCGRLFGMPEADALAASLGLWFAHLAVGAVGGALQLAGRRRENAAIVRP